VLKAVRRRLLPSIHYSGTRLLRRVDNAVHRINPYLLALAVGLIVLNVTFFIGMKVSATPDRLRLGATDHFPVDSSRADREVKARRSDRCRRQTALAS